MTGIRDRLEDAEELWKNGRREGAFLCVLIAFCSTAKKRYPKLGDRERFEKLYADTRPGTLGSEYRGEMHKIEHIFYRWVRCELVHKADIPVDMRFMEEDKPGTMSFRAGGAPGYIIKLGWGWINFFRNAVVNAPENKELFPDAH